MRRGKFEAFKEAVFRYRNSLFCILAGVLLFLLAQIAGGGGPQVTGGMLERNSTGEGDRVYEFYVEGLSSDREFMTVTVPERALTKEELEERLMEAAALLGEKICGENPSLKEVRTDLKLMDELPEFGLSVSWESNRPELVSNTGLLGEERPENGEEVRLLATLFTGAEDGTLTVEIPVKVFPPKLSAPERFSAALTELAGKNREEAKIPLPEEFDGKGLTYQNPESSENYILLLLGAVAAVCIPLQEKSRKEEEKKRREEALLLDYPDMLSRFLVLTGAGYPARQAIKKQTEDFKKSGEPGFHPIYGELETALRQMEAGTPEIAAYEAFGRRTGLQCYVKFASLLGSSLDTGGRNLRILLEGEMEEAFKQRKDLAKRRGEEASTKLLLPMFLMLGVVMVMVVAPAFLTLA